MQKVLYVDDEEQNRVVFDATFSDEFELQFASSGDAALRMLEDEAFAVIVADQRMPGMTGNQLLSKVRDRHPDVVRIVLTGYSDVEAILAAVNEGLVARYLVKPWNEDELRGILRWACQIYHLGTAGDIRDRLVEAERLASLGMIHASFMHEARRPLMHITLNSDELRELGRDVSEIIDALATGFEPEHPVRARLDQCLQTIQDLCGDISEGSRLLGQLLDDVETLLYVGKSRDESHSSPEQVRRAIDFCLSVNGVEASENGVILRFQPTEELPALQLDPARLMQVLINVLRNAVQSFEDLDRGGTVELSVEKVEGFALITIADDGRGMPHDLTARIGRQFETTRNQGTGLGVFRCRTILEQIGGRLTYESEEGRGTRVTARIPLAES